MREGIIYLITNTVNEKKYVGKTVQKKGKRWRQHQDDAACNRYKSALHAAIRKYGRDAFTVEVVAESLEPFLDTLEIFFIRLYRSRAEQHGYNLTEGGDGIFGLRLSDETRKKLSEAHKGLEFTAEHRRKLSESATGRRASTQARLNMSIGQKSKRISAESQARIDAARRGRRCSQQTRDKLSRANKGNTNCLGRKHPAETLEKMRQAWERRRERTTPCLES